jgi:AcrR family transcriptional regulator
MEKHKAHRRYHSPRRQAQARQTRQQIVAAARQLFIERSYAGATIEAIAQQAGVSVETIYAVFGSKKNVLKALVDVSVAGDDQPLTLLERPGPQAVLQERNQHRQVQMFAKDIATIISRVAPIFEVLHDAARAEPDIAAYLEQLLEQRLQGMGAFIAALSSNGPLRTSLDLATTLETTVETAAITTWAITSPEVFTLLTVRRGWSLGRYQAWLADALDHLLLP